MPQKVSDHHAMRIAPNADPSASDDSLGVDPEATQPEPEEGIEGRVVRRLEQIHDRPGDEPDAGEPAAPAPAVGGAAAYDPQDSSTWTDEQHPDSVPWDAYRQTSASASGRLSEVARLRESVAGLREETARQSEITRQMLLEEVQGVLHPEPEPQDIRSLLDTVDERFKNDPALRTVVEGIARVDERLSSREAREYEREQHEQLADITRRAVSDTVTWADQQHEAFVAQNPGVSADGAYEYWRNSRLQDKLARRIPEAVALQEIANEDLQLLVDARDPVSGFDPVMHVVQTARNIGWDGTGPVPGEGDDPDPALDPKTTPGVPLAGTPAHVSQRAGDRAAGISRGLRQASMSQVQGAQVAAGGAGGRVTIEEFSQLPATMKHKLLRDKKRWRELDSTGSTTLPG